MENNSVIEAPAINTPSDAQAAGLDAAAMPSNAEVRMANRPGETPAETAARLYKVKVDGQEYEVDEDELRRGYAHNRAANERLRQATETRNLAEQVLNIFKTNPQEAFKRLGVDAKAFAEQVLQADMEERVLTPEQRELRDLKAFKEQKAAEEAEQRRQQEQQQEEAFRSQVAEELQTGIIGALQTADLPKNEYTVGRMAFYLESALTAGYNATPADVVGLVKKEYESEVTRLLSSIGEDKLLGFLGDDITKKVVKAHIAKTGAKKKVAPPSPGVKLEPKEEAPKRPATLRDFFRNRTA